MRRGRFLALKVDRAEQCQRSYNAVYQKMLIFGVIPLIKLQNDTETTVKR